MHRCGNVTGCNFALDYRRHQAHTAGRLVAAPTRADSRIPARRGGEVLEMADQPLEIRGEVTLQPWEFWIVSGS